MGLARKGLMLLLALREIRPETGRFRRGTV